MRWFDTETRSAKILQMMERKLIFKSDQLSRKLGVSEKQSPMKSPSLTDSSQALH